MVWFTRLSRARDGRRAVSSQVVGATRQSAAAHRGCERVVSGFVCPRGRSEAVTAAYRTGASSRGAGSPTVSRHRRTRHWRRTAPVGSGAPSPPACWTEPGATSSFASTATTPGREVRAPGLPKTTQGHQSEAPGGTTAVRPPFAAAMHGPLGPPRGPRCPRRRRWQRRASRKVAAMRPASTNSA